MLTYLIKVSQDVLLMSLAIGVVFAYLRSRYGLWGKRIAWMGFGLGILSGSIRTAVIKTTRIRNQYLYTTSWYSIVLLLFLIVILATIVFSIKPVRRAVKEKVLTVVNFIVPSCVALMVAFYLFLSLPTVIMYPFQFNLGDSGILSKDFLLRLAGWLITILLAALCTLAVDKLGSVLYKKGYRGVLVALFFIITGIYAFNLFTNLTYIVTPRNMIKPRELNSFLFKYVAIKAGNNREWYTYIAYIVVLVTAIFAWVESFIKKEPYKTNAERRKLRADWKTARRYSVVPAICLILAVLCSTTFVELNTVVVTEAPSETPLVVQNDFGEDDHLQIPLTSVDDGHLHRFEYVTPDGYHTRVIVLLKQLNTGNYGVGLDACEICGEAGYYEDKDGQVICKKCGVVMNRSTIGMKGGCNPIIIDYDINDTDILIPVSELIDNQKSFSK